MRNRRWTFRPVRLCISQFLNFSISQFFRGHCFQYEVLGIRASAVALQAGGNCGAERHSLQFQSFRAGFDAGQAQQVQDQRVQSIALPADLFDEVMRLLEEYRKGKS